MHADQPSIPQPTTHLTEAVLQTQLLQAERDVEELTAQLVETQDQLLAMYDLTRATRSHLGLGETLRRLVAEAARLLRVRCAVLFVTPTMVQHPASLLDERQLLALFQSAQTSGRDLLVSAPAAQVPDGVTHLCILPIQIQGVMTAGLALIDRPGGYTAPDLKLARAIAEQAAAQIEHALLYQERIEQARIQTELAIARRVQLQLLPQSRPSVPSLDIYAESRPALQVGGDFYDFVSDPDRPLTMMLGDVAGKGISAAMIMGMVHVASQAATRFMPNATPAAILGRTNTDLYDDLTLLDSFTTAFVAQYDPSQHTLHYANAGHAPVIYRPPGGPAQLLEADGVPIGVLPINLCENYTLDFGPGALLVVTTDGFSEARNLGGELFGYERLLRLVDEFADQPAQVIAYGLYDAIDNFAVGQPQEDDQTLVVVKGRA